MFAWLDEPFQPPPLLAAAQQIPSSTMIVLPAMKNG